MREKHIFFIGFGTGLVLTAIISLFLYNISKDSSKGVNLEPYTTTTEFISEEDTIYTTKSIDLSENIKTTTTKSMEIITSKSMEITTSKPFEITTN